MRNNVYDETMTKRANFRLTDTNSAKLDELAAALGVSRNIALNVAIEIARDRLNAASAQAAAAPITSHFG